MSTKLLKLATCALITISLLGAGQSGALAIDGNGRFYALGAGHRLCSDYVNFREKRLENLTPEHYEMADFVIEHWVAGFMTAHNFYVADTYDVVGAVTMNQLTQRIEQYCRANPNKRIAEGVIALSQELHPNRIKVGAVAGEGKKEQSR